MKTERWATESDAASQMHLFFDAEPHGSKPIYKIIGSTTEKDLATGSACPFRFLSYGVRATNCFLVLRNCGEGWYLKYVRLSEIDGHELWLADGPKVEDTANKESSWEDYLTWDA